MEQHIDLTRSQEYLIELERRLEKCIKEGQLDFYVDYRSISQSFPGDPHPGYFGVPCIDWNSFEPWANGNGWDVQEAPEQTHQAQQSTPRIRFTRKDHG